MKRHSEASRGSFGGQSNTHKKVSTIALLLMEMVAPGVVRIVLFISRNLEALGRVLSLAGATP